MKRSLIILPLILLLACSRDNEWAFDQIHSEKKEFQSTKLSIHSPDPVNGIDLELIKTQDHLKVYLNVHSVAIPSLCEQPKTTIVKVSAGQEIHHFEARILSGEQRLLLSEESIPLFLTLLKENEQLCINIPGYRSVIQRGNFVEQYKKLLHPFPFENRFQLPF